MRLWKAVSLSLGIDPTNEATEAFKSCGTAYRTLYRLRRNKAINSLSGKEGIGTIFGYPNDPNSGDGPSEQMVNMHSFVAWLVNRGAELPKEMAEIWAPDEGALADSATLSYDGRAKSEPSDRTKNAALGNQMRSMEKILLGLVQMAQPGCLVARTGNILGLSPSVKSAIKELGLSIEETTIDEHLMRTYERHLSEPQDAWLKKSRNSSNLPRNSSS